MTKSLGVKKGRGVEKLFYNPLLYFERRAKLSVCTMVQWCILLLFLPLSMQPSRSYSDWSFYVSLYVQYMCICVYQKPNYQCCTSVFINFLVAWVR